MSPVFPARRRADEFDRLAEAAFAGELDGSSDLHELAGLAARMHALPAVAPRPEFSAALRSRLMTAAATELGAADPEVADRLTVNRLAGSGRRRERRIAAGIAALAVVGATAGTALASQGTLPGDALYPVKRAMENIQAGFSVGDQAKGTDLLADANTRLAEVRQLSQRHEPTDATQIQQTLTAFASQARSASDLLIEAYQVKPDPAALANLRTFAAQSVAQLTALEASIPASARTALSQAAQTLLSIDRAAQNLCPDCGGTGLLRLPSSLLSGLATATGPTSGRTPSPGAGQNSSGPSTGPSQNGGTTGTPGPTTSPTPGVVIPPLLPTPGSSPGVTGSPSKGADHTGTSGTSSNSKPGSSASSPSSPGGAVGDLIDGLNDAVGGLLGTGQK